MNKPAIAINGNKQTLAETALHILDLYSKDNTPLHYSDIAKLCLAAGYKTRARDFPNLVFMVLSKLEKEKKIERLVQENTVKWRKI